MIDRKITKAVRVGGLMLGGGNPVLVQSMLNARADDIPANVAQAQRLEAAEMLLQGNTYEQIVKSVRISTATISRINQCIQYGSGGYRTVVSRLQKD